MRIALTNDHTGFEQIRQLQAFLEAKGHQCQNFGPTSLDLDDDYPVFVALAAQAVASGKADFGIILGGSGQGEAMAANRFKGVRAAVYYGPAQAQTAIDAEGRTAIDHLEMLRLSRQHNNANMLSLSARFLSQADIEQAAALWLETPFSQAERHQRRIQQLDEIN